MLCGFMSLAGDSMHDSVEKFALGVSGIGWDLEPLNWGNWFYKSFIKIDSPVVKC